MHQAVAQELIDACYAVEMLPTPALRELISRVEQQQQQLSLILQPHDETPPTHTPPPATMLRPLLRRNPDSEGLVPQEQMRQAHGPQEQGLGLREQAQCPQRHGGAHAPLESQGQPISNGKGDATPLPPLHRELSYKL